MFILTFLATPSRLAQSTGFEVGETFGISASVDEDGTYSKSGDVFIEKYDLDATLVGRPYVDAVATIPTSPDLIDNISPNPYPLHAFSSSSLPSHSPECRNMSLVNHHDVLQRNLVGRVEPLGTFGRHNSSLDPYRLYLGGIPTKIMLTFAFNPSRDFSWAFNKFRRELTIISTFMFKCSYSHSSELYAQVFDKLLQTLTAVSYTHLTLPTKRIV